MAKKEITICDGCGKDILPIDASGYYIEQGVGTVWQIRTKIPVTQWYDLELCLDCVRIAEKAKEAYLKSKNNISISDIVIRVQDDSPGVINTSHLEILANQK